jgi:hypothetical protein
MMYQALWIEGSRALYDFCEKRFKESPRFIETIGHCGSATIWLSYKLTPTDGYRDFYLIFMPHDHGNFTYMQLQDKKLEKYEQIMAYATTVRK